MMGLFDFLKRKKELPPGPASGEEQAVLVYLDGQNLPDEVYDSCDTETLEELLQLVLERTGVGEFDGTETGPTGTCCYLYGPNAERLFEAIELVLKGYPLCQGSRVVIRYGGPGAREREARLPVT